MAIADGYFLALLLSFAGAFFIVSKRKWSFIASALCITLSLGLYQAYLPICFGVICLYMIRRLLARAIEDLKSIFGDLIISLFLYRKPAKLAEFEKEEREREQGKEITEEQDKKIADIAKTRYEKAQAISRIYIENIQMFDHVILNIDDCKKYTETQITHIVEELTEAVQGLKKQS